MIPMAVSPPTKVPPIAAAASANIPNILCSPFFDVDHRQLLLDLQAFVNLVLVCSSCYGHIIVHRELRNPCKDLCF